MKRINFLSVLIFSLVLIGYIAASEHLDVPKEFSFQTLFRVMGQPLKSADRFITKAMGVSIKDEKELGILIAKDLKHWEIPGHTEQKDYLAHIIKTLAQEYNPKGLDFNVFIIDGPPNAFAVPGGNIAISASLLGLLQNESQLVGILGHEKGHIDLGHCIDGMRTMAKGYRSNMGNFMTWYFKQLMRTNFSKFQENESDKYGFETLISSGYDPSGLGESFVLMSKENLHPKGSAGVDIWQDYRTTHPDLQIRSENWLEKAKRYKYSNPNKTFHDDNGRYLQIMAPFRSSLD